MVKTIQKIKDKIKARIDLSQFPFEFEVWVPSSFHVISLRRQREVTYDSDLIDEGLKKYIIYEGRYLLIASLKGRTYVTKIRFSPHYITGFYLQPWGGSPPNEMVRSKEYYLLRPNGQWELINNPLYSKQRSPVLVSSH